MTVGRSRNPGFKMDLREILRARTSAAHDRVDALYGRLTLANRDGLTHFLYAHAMALQAIEAAVKAAAPDSGCPLGLHRLARLDLETLGASAPEPATFRELGSAHPDGLIYVVAGSHLGTGVLRKRWRRSTDRVVLSAGRYLTASEMRAYWPMFLDRLRSRRPGTLESKAISASAMVAFSVFEHAFRRAEEGSERRTWRLT